MRAMIVAVAAALTLLFATASEAQYIRGPRGGCYAYSKSGRKRYVAREMCDVPSGAKASRKTTPGAAGSEYHLGPKGGCYKITASGNKRYVDRSLCKN